MAKVRVITKKQYDLLIQARVFYNKNGYSPTVRELALINKTNANNVWKMLRSLEKKGAIRLVPKISRGIIFED